MKRICVATILAFLMLTSIACTQSAPPAKTTKHKANRQLDLAKYKELDEHWALRLSEPTTKPKISKKQAIDIAKNGTGGKSIVSIDAFYAKVHNGSLKGDYWIVVIVDSQGVILNKGYGESYFGPTEAVVFLSPDGKVASVMGGGASHKEQLDPAVQSKLRAEVEQFIGPFGNGDIRDLVVLDNWALGISTDLHDRKGTLVLLQKTNMKWAIVARGNDLTQANYPKSPKELWEISKKK